MNIKLPRLGTAARALLIASFAASASIPVPVFAQGQTPTQTPAKPAGQGPKKPAGQTPAQTPGQTPGQKPGTTTTTTTPPPTPTTTTTTTKAPTQGNQTPGQGPGQAQGSGAVTITLGISGGGSTLTFTYGSGQAWPRNYCMSNDELKRSMQSAGFRDIDIYRSGPGPVMAFVEAEQGQLVYDLRVNKCNGRVVVLDRD